MIELSENFKTHFNNLLNADNSDLDLIIELMRHPKRKAGRKLLGLINDIMGYYMQRTDIDTIVRYPILYVPASEAWAQEVCVEFITLKLALLYNDLIREKLKQETRNLHYPANCTTNARRRRVKDAFDYFQLIYNNIQNREIPTCDKSKNLIVCQPFNEEHRRFNYLAYLCGCRDNIGEFCLDQRHNFTDYCAVSWTNRNIYSLDNVAHDNDIYKIKNIFVFLSKSANGRYTDEAYSFQRPLIENHNNKRGRVRNVFYFYFSTKPYKLQRLWTWRHTRAVDMLHDSPNNMKDFITLSPAETDYIFNRNNTRQHELVIPLSVENEEYNEIKGLADEALGACEYSIQVRNDLAICYDNEATKSFSERYRDKIDDIGSPYFNIFLKTIEETWSQKIAPEIQSFLRGATRAAIILDYFTSEEVKERLKRSFEERFGIIIDIGDFRTLKHPETIQGDRIVVLSYQGHYSDKPYARFPNSFDPIPVENGKKLLNIIDQFVFDTYYTYTDHRYTYYRILHNVLQSDYRTHLDADIQLPQRPVLKTDDNSDRSITTNAHNPNEAHVRFSATTIDGGTIRLTQSDYLICKEKGEDNEQMIITVQTLSDIMQDENMHFLISKLSDIQNKLKGILDEKVNDTTAIEQKIRKDQKYNLTEQEQQSLDELWEILLQRKVREKGPEEVYNELMRSVPDNEHISITAFERWYTPDNGMIFPRSRRMQNAVISYLDLDPLYNKIIRKKKAQSGNNTEYINSTLRAFLCNNLLSSDYNQSFNELSDELKEMFELKTAGDMKALLDLLKENITYKEITSITRP